MRTHSFFSLSSWHSVFLPCLSPSALGMKELLYAPTYQIQWYASSVRDLDVHGAWPVAYVVREAVMRQYAPDHFSTLPVTTVGPCFPVRGKGLLFWRHKYIPWGQTKDHESVPFFHSFPLLRDWYKYMDTQQSPAATSQGLSPHHGLHTVSHTEDICESAMATSLPVSWPFHGSCPKALSTFVSFWYQAETVRTIKHNRM